MAHKVVKKKKKEVPHHPLCVIYDVCLETGHKQRAGVCMALMRNALCYVGQRDGVAPPIPPPSSLHSWSAFLNEEHWLLCSNSDTF